MARYNRETAIGWIGLSEGGYVNDPRDPGGATDRGITQRTYDAWMRRQGKETRPVKGISKADADQIIVAQYFAPVRFDDLPSGLDYAMADYAVNSGPGRAIKELQRLVGVGVDGVMGAQTLAAVAKVPAVTLIRELCEARIAYMRRIRHPKTGALLWDTFGNGWTTRVMGKRAGAQDDDIGVIDRATRLSRRDDLPETEWREIPAPHVAQGRAPEPDVDAGGGAATIGIGGAVAGAGGVLTAIADLHPAVQALAVAGVLLALYVIWQAWQAGKVRL